MAVVRFNARILRIVEQVCAYIILVNSFTWCTLYKILKYLLKVILHQYSVKGIENITEVGGAIYVCNHAGNYGPLAMELFFPLKFRSWAIYRVMTRRLCRKQLEKDLFGKCYPIFKPLCRIAAFVIEPACLWVMRKSKAIPVYRGDIRIFTTFRLSVDALKENSNIALFPEKDEPENDNELKDFYTGFVHIARKYYNETGEILLFYPVCIDRKERIITILKPTAYDPDVDFKIERNILANRIKEAINFCTRDQR